MRVTKERLSGSARQQEALRGGDCFAKSSLVKSARSPGTRNLMRLERHIIRNSIKRIVQLATSPGPVPALGVAAGSLGCPGVAAASAGLPAVLRSLLRLSMRDDMRVGQRDLDDETGLGSDVVGGPGRAVRINVCLASLLSGRFLFGEGIQDRRASSAPSPFLRSARIARCRNRQDTPHPWRIERIKAFQARLVLDFATGPASRHAQ